jgi:RNA polymerase sigma factor (sigma-70 family)
VTQPPSPPGPDRVGPEGTTNVLLTRAREGDARAREILLERLRRPLQRWAHGKLPSIARGAVDTDDLVQDTLARTLGHIDQFQPQGEGALLAYLRRTLLNLIRDEVDKIKRRPRRAVFHEQIPGNGPSPLDSAITEETLHRFDEALGRLPERHQEAVFLRIELGYTYREIAEAIDGSNEHAARMFVTRALIRLAKEMNGSRNRDRAGT